MNTIYEAIRSASAKDLEEIAGHIWMEFDLQYSLSAQNGSEGGVAGKGAVMELLLDKAGEAGSLK